MSNNPSPNTIYLQWDGDAEPSEPCSADPDDRDVTWCRERVFARDIQFERSARIKELDRELEQERALADRLAETLASVQVDYASTGAITTPEVAESLVAWKEARSGTV